MSLQNRRMPSRTAVLSVVPGPTIRPSTASKERPPEKWSWGYAIMVMILVSAASWTGFAAIILL